MRRLRPFIFILLAAFALRVHLLGNQELRGDEGFTWNYIQKPPLEIVATIIREGDPQPPIHYWLQWGWAQLTGETEFAMRAWSAVLSLVLVPLMYQAGRRLWDEAVGLLAASLTAIHPQQIWLAQDVRNMYPLALIALLIATLILPELVAHKSNRWKYWLGYVACGTFAMYSHYYSLFFLIAHGAYLLAPSPAGIRPTGEGRGRGWARWITAGLAIAALVAPWAIVILPVYSRGQLADPGSLSFIKYTTAVFGDLAAGPAFADSTKLAITLVFSGLAALGAFTLSPFHRVTPSSSLPASPSPRLPAYLIPSILVPFIGIYTVTATRSTFNSFYFVFAAPAAYLLAAGGMLAVYRRASWLGTVMIIIAIIMYGIGLGNHYNDPQYSKTRGMRDVAARLAESAQPGDIYLANFPDPAQVYYVHGLGLNYHMQPGGIGFDPAQVDAELDRLLAHRIWFVPVNSIVDPEAYVQNRLLKTAILAEDDRFNKMRLMLFLPPTASRPLDARFADGVRLVGYYLTPNRLTLIWSAYATPSADYTAFVHALAADTFNLTGHDARPTTPTSQWQPGQLIVDVHEFDIPTDQPITLVAGMYLPTTGDRLTLETESFGESNAARVTTLTP